MKIPRISLRVSLIAGTITSGIYINYPALKSLPVIYNLKQTRAEDLLDSGDAKSTLHKDLLKKGIYVPLEDIIYESEIPDSNELKRACGRGKIYLWFPIPIKIPFLGHKTYEWCLNLH